MYIDAREADQFIGYASFFYTYKGKVKIFCEHSDDELTVKVKDEGRGIEDIKKALQPFYTTEPESERSGMGFTVMESFMDSVEIETVLGKDTLVSLKKYIGKSGVCKE